jgi:hypothetical protein
MAKIRQEIRVLLRAWNLAARKFDAILRIIFFKLSSDVSWKQVSHFHPKNPGNDEQFKVGNTPFLIFKVCHRFAAGVPTEQLQLDREFVLTPALSLAKFPHLRPHDIQYFNTFFDSRTLAIAARNRVSFTRHLKRFCRFLLAVMLIV